MRTAFARFAMSNTAIHIGPSLHNATGAAMLKMQ